MGVGPDEFQHHEEHWISSSSKLETKGTGRVPSWERLLRGGGRVRLHCKGVLCYVIEDFSR